MRQKQKTAGRSTAAIMSGVIFGAAVLFWAFLQWITPNYFLFDDNANQFIGLLKFHWISLFEHHEIPMVNFHQYAGIDHLGESQTGFFNPLTHLATALSLLFTGDFFWAVDILTLLHMIVGTAGMYGLLRFMRISRKLSLSIALLWLTTPYFVLVAKSWHTIGPVFAIFPWSFLMTLRLSRGPTAKNMWLTALLKAATFYICHPQFAFIAYVSEAVFLIVTCLFRFPRPVFSAKARTEFVETAKTRRQAGNRYLLSWAIALVLILPKLLPVLASMSASGRAGALEMAHILQSAIEPVTFFKAQIGLITESAIFGSESAIYFIGILCLLLALTPFLFLKHRDIVAGLIPKRPAALIALGVFVAIGTITLLTACTQYPEALPYFSVLIMGAAAAIVTIRLMLAAIPNTEPERSNILILGVSALILFLMGTKLYLLLAWLPVFDHFRWPFKHFHYALFFFLLFAGAYLQNVIQRTHKNNKRFVFVLLCLAIAGNIVIAATSGKGDKNALGAFVVHAGYSDPFGGNTLLSTPLAPPVRGEPSRRFENGDRLNNMAYPIEKHSYRTLFFSAEENFTLDHKKAPDWLLFNFPTFWGYMSLDGYFGLTPLISRTIGLDPLKLSSHYGVLRAEFLQEESIQEHLKNWSARYLLTENRPENRMIASTIPELILLAEKTDTLLYEYTVALPIVRFRDRPEYPVRFEITTNKITIRPEDRQGGTLEVAIAPLPGYRYRIDQGPFQRIDRQDPLQPKPIQIELLPGNETVELRYRNEAFYLGLKMMLSALTVLALWHIVRKQKR